MPGISKIPEVGTTGELRWYAEFEFRTDFQNHYWMPLLIHASSREDAASIVESIRLELDSHYMVMKPPAPMPYLGMIFVWATSSGNCLKQIGFRLWM